MDKQTITPEQQLLDNDGQQTSTNNQQPVAQPTAAPQQQVFQGHAGPSNWISQILQEDETAEKSNSNQQSVNQPTTDGNQEEPTIKIEGQQPPPQAFQRKKKVAKLVNNTKETPITIMDSDEEEEMKRQQTTNQTSSNIPVADDNQTLQKGTPSGFSFGTSTPSQQNLFSSNKQSAHGVGSSTGGGGGGGDIFASTSGVMPVANFAGLMNTSGPGPGPDQFVRLQTLIANSRHNRVNQQATNEPHPFGRAKQKPQNQQRQSFGNQSLQQPKAKESSHSHSPVDKQKQPPKYVQNQLPQEFINTKQKGMKVQSRQVQSHLSTPTKNRDQKKLEHDTKKLKQAMASHGGKGFAAISFDHMMNEGYKGGDTPVSSARNSNKSEVANISGDQLFGSVSKQSNRSSDQLHFKMRQRQDTFDHAQTEMRKKRLSKSQEAMIPADNDSDQAEQKSVESVTSAFNDKRLHPLAACCAHLGSSNFNQLDQTFVFKKLEQGGGNQFDRFTHGEVTLQPPPGSNKAQTSIRTLENSMDKFVAIYRKQTQHLGEEECKRMALDLPMTERLIFIVLQSWHVTSLHLRTQEQLPYIPADWPKTAVLTFCFNIFSDMILDSHSQSDFWTFLGEEGHQVVFDISAKLSYARTESKVETPAWAAFRTWIAFRMGFLLTGGFRCFELYTASPPSLLQTDIHFIQKRLRALKGALGLTDQQWTDEVINRNADYIRRHICKNILQRSDAASNIDGITPEKYLVREANNRSCIRQFFALMTGEGLVCPYCGKMQAKEQITQHLKSGCLSNNKGRNPPPDLSSNYQSYCILLDDNMYYSPLDNYRASTPAEVYEHLKIFDNRTLLLMGFLKHLKPLDFEQTVLDFFEEVENTDKPEYSMTYPKSWRKWDLMYLAQSDRTSEPADEEPDDYQVAGYETYFQKVIKEALLVDGQNEQKTQQLLKFSQHTKKADILRLSLHRIANFLQCSSEGRTYLLQGVFDVSKGSHCLTDALHTLGVLVSGEGKFSKLNSLTYAVFVCAQTKDSQYCQYTHYFIVRQHLFTCKFEIWDSYREFSDITLHDMDQDTLLNLIATENDPALRPQTQSSHDGEECFWLMMKDLICLTGFRSTRVLKRGGEKGFSMAQCHLVRKENESLTTIIKIANLLYELVIACNRPVIRRIYGKECTYKRNLIHSFATELNSAATDAETYCTTSPLSQADQQIVKDLRYRGQKQYEYPSDEIPFALVPELPLFASLDFQSLYESQYDERDPVDSESYIQSLYEKYIQDTDETQGVLRSFQVPDYEATSPTKLTGADFTVNEVQTRKENMRSKLEKDNRQSSVRESNKWADQQETDGPGSVERRREITGAIRKNLYVTGDCNKIPALTSDSGGYLVYINMAPSQPTDLIQQLDVCIPDEPDEWKLPSDKDWIKFQKRQDKLATEFGLNSFFKVLIWDSEDTKWARDCQHLLHTAFEAYKKFKTGDSTSFQDPTIYMLFVDKKTDNLNLLTVNPVSHTGQFIGDNRQSGELFNEILIVLEGIGLIFNGPQFNIVTTLTSYVKRDFLFARNAQVFFALAYSMTTRTHCTMNLNEVNIYCVDAMSRFAARAFNSTKTHLSLSCQMFFAATFGVTRRVDQPLEQQNPTTLNTTGPIGIFLDFLTCLTNAINGMDRNTIQLFAQRPLVTAQIMESRQQRKMANTSPPPQSQHQEKLPGNQVITSQQAAEQSAPQVTSDQTIQMVQQNPLPQQSDDIQVQKSSGVNQGVNQETHQQPDSGGLSGAVTQDRTPQVQRQGMATQQSDQEKQSQLSLNWDQNDLSGFLKSEKNQDDNDDEESDGQGV